MSVKMERNGTKEREGGKWKERETERRRDRHMGRHIDRGIKRKEFLFRIN
jgi:hypothetical protein